MKQFSERQQEIINAALDIIAVQGIQRLTIKNLARTVKVSEPALYRHFNSKFSILLSILLHYKQSLMAILEQKTGQDQPPIHRIESLYDGIFQSFSKRPQLSMVVFSEDLFRFDRRLSQEVFSIIEMTHDRISGILREGTRHGEIRSDVPAKQMAWMVMGSMRLLITKWMISGYSLDLIREGHQVFAFIRTVLAP